MSETATQSVTIFTNMVTPYTSRLYNDVARKRRLSVVSCTSQEANRNWAASFEEHYEHTVLPGFEVRLGPSRFAHLNSRIGATLDRLSPDVVAINGLYPSMLIAAFWAMVRRKRLVWKTDGWVHTMPNSLLHRIARRFVLSRTCKVIVCGSKGRQYFLDLGVARTNIAIVPLVPAWDGPAEPPAYEERQYDLVWCGHIENEVKNANFFASVCENLKTLRSTMTVLVVGTGKDERELLGRLSAASIDFTHVPAVPWREMRSIFSRAKLLVLPSLSEAWGLVVNEAMQCGVPSLVSRFVGAADDLVVDGMNGHVLDLFPAVWARKANDVLEDMSRWSSFSVRAHQAARSRTAEDAASALNAAFCEGAS